MTILLLQALQGAEKFSGYNVSIGKLQRFRGMGESFRVVNLAHGHRQ
ncbi:MAG: hypothetical protein LW870_05775 [Pirellula sp.]|jgi:hypothetical protein|nr:hypothetical protein [Pirellula sp.]